MRSGRKASGMAMWALGLVGLLVFGSEPTWAESPLSVSKATADMHQGTLVFDAHNNLVVSLLQRKNFAIDDLDLERFQQGLHTDLPRLRQGGVGAQFFATYVPSTSVKKGTMVRETLEQIETIKAIFNRYPQMWQLAATSDDVERLQRERRLAGLIAIENGDAIDGSLAVLRSYYEAGARCMALAHDDTHGWADSALDKSKHGGLSRFGEQVVAEMNRLGMVIDLSHSADETVLDTLTLTKAPVIFSHSGARSIGPHPRNLSDDVLRKVALNGGVVHVNFFSGYLTKDSVAAYEKRSKAAHEFRKTFKNEEQFQLALPAWLNERPLPVTMVAHVVDHIDHIVKIAGVDHVGLGSNFDGAASLPKDLDDVSCFPKVTQELLRRGYAERDVRKILGQNTLRVLREVERISLESRGSRSTAPVAARTQ